MVTPVNYVKQNGTGVGLAVTGSDVDTTVASFALRYHSTSQSSTWVDTTVESRSLPVGT